MKKVQLLIITGLMAVALAMAGCSSCGSPAIPDSPDGTAKVVLEQLDAKNPGIVWAALPKSYQTDINDVVQKFAGKMDKELYDKAFVIAGKVTDVVKSKKEFILGSKMVAPMVGKNKEEVSKNWDAFVEILDIIVKSDINKLDNLKSFDGGKCLNGLVKDLYVQADKLKDLKMFKEAMDEDMPTSFKDFKIEKVKADDKTATIKVTIKDDSEELEMVKVEERWVPKDMADGWKDAIKEAKKGIAKMSDDVTKNKTQALAMMAMAESVIDQLKEAKTQEEFDKVLMGLGRVF